MTLLLSLAAGLLLVSGLVKIKAWSRVAPGVPVLPLVETLLGLALFVALLFGGVDAAAGLWLVSGSVVLVVVSSWMLGSDLRRRRGRRQSTEGARLRSYLKYLSQPPPDG